MVIFEISRAEPQHITLTVPDKSGKWNIELVITVTVRREVGEE
jgi:hypothetical protein